jgi:hypothetical protein
MISTEIFEESKKTGSSPKGVKELRNIQNHIGDSLLSIFSLRSDSEKYELPEKFIFFNS